MMRAPGQDDYRGGIGVCAGPEARTIEVLKARVIEDLKCEV